MGTEYLLADQAMRPVLSTLRMATSGTGTQAGRRQVRAQMAALLGLEMRTGLATRGAVAADIGYLVEPLLDMGPHLRLIGEMLAIEAVALDVFDAGLDLALALRIVAAMTTIFVWS